MFRQLKLNLKIANTWQYATAVLFWDLHFLDKEDLSLLLHVTVSAETIINAI